MMLTFLGFNFIFNHQPHVWMDIGLMFVYYGLYYGVLGRDVSEICTDKMAANIGVRILRFQIIDIHLLLNFQFYFLVLHTSGYTKS